MRLLLSCLSVFFFSIPFLIVILRTTIIRATAAGFSKLSERISHLEDALLLQHHMQGGGGDQNLPPEEEEEEEAEQERR